MEGRLAMKTTVENRVQETSTRWRAPRYWLLGAAAVSCWALSYHLAAGPGEVLAPLYAADLPVEAVSTVDLFFYQLAALVAGGAVGMVVAAFRTEWRKPLAWFIGTHYLAISAVSLGFSFAWFGDPFGLIQWAVFSPLALITILAARSTKSPATARD
ncbi:hypothetical protein ACFFGH_25690 [Lysobacter korlensis]|uniref:Uncharacterized protein n=1 Tax=Lysobacter korlensis TaxID=553636 RepID=A0ABV6RXP3_9GAMM